MRGILTHLLRIAEREGIDTDEDDLRLMLGEDDNDLLGNIASWAWENGIMDHEDLFIELGIPAEIFIDSGDGPDVSDGLVEITDGTGYTEGNISRELE